MANPILPEDLLIDILLRLPVKSLIKFRCASKSWHTLLTNPTFITKHLTFTTLKTNENLIIHTQPKHVITLIYRTPINNNSSFILELPFGERVPNNSYLKIVGSCNGLVCFSLCVNGMNLYLWNIATREYMSLPQPQIMFPQGKRRHVVYTAFGFDPNTSDYQVVRFLHLKNVKKNVSSVEDVEVYSKNVGFWREIDAALDCAISEFSSNVVVSGVVHWMGIRMSDSIDVIVCFDLGNRVFKEMVLPGSYDYKGNFGWFLAVLGESMGVVVFPTRKDRNKCVDVWVMKEHGVNESWSKQVSFRLFPGVSRPIGCCRNGELIMQNDKNKLLLYDPGSRKFKTLPASNTRYAQDVQGYTESLVPIREEIGLGEQ